MARQHRRRAPRRLYYACVYQLTKLVNPKSVRAYEQDWLMVHWVPSRTIDRCMKTAVRLRKRYPHWEYIVDAPAVRFIPGDEPT